MNLIISSNQDGDVLTLKAAKDAADLVTPATAVAAAGAEFSDDFGDDFKV